MPEVATNETSSHGRIVTLKDNRVGRVIADVGKSFELSNIYSETSGQLGGDRFVELYLRTAKKTDDGLVYNLYRLDDEGKLIDASESKRLGSISARNFPKDELEKTIVTVGKPFEVPGKGYQTVNVVEIVAATNKAYMADHMKMLTRGKSNGIIEEFENGMPSDLEDYLPYSRR